MSTKITIRRKKISKGRESLYFDYYPPVRHPETLKPKHHEHLGIYIYTKPKNEEEREFNKAMLGKAEGMRSLRLIQLINEEYGFLDKQKYNGDFLAYFWKLAVQNRTTWKMVYGHFSKFVGGRCSFAEVTVDLCRRFREYLLTADHLDNPGKKIANNTAAGYFSTFRGMLNVALRDKWLRENVNDYLDKIELEEVKKEFLTIEELFTLMETPCEVPVLKSASIFACLTGLRISDVMNLTWEDIEDAPEGGYNMRITTIKTGAVATLPVNTDALEQCGERRTGKVFAGLTRYMVTNPLQKWLKAAGITKHITFHSFRHTYATLQITMGTDIFTVSKMLTHKNVTTTQIYAELVSDKKREASETFALDGMRQKIRPIELKRVGS